MLDCVSDRMQDKKNKIKLRSRNTINKLLRPVEFPRIHINLSPISDNFLRKRFQQFPAVHTSPLFTFKSVHVQTRISFTVRQFYQIKRGGDAMLQWHLLGADLDRYYSSREIDSCPWSTSSLSMPPLLSMEMEGVTTAWKSSYIFYPQVLLRKTFPMNMDARQWRFICFN